MSSNVECNNRPDYDQVIQDIADYVLHFNIASREAMNTARHCLMDTLGCGLLALNFSECIQHLGPIVEGTVVPYGARVPGTSFKLDPVKAAWDIGCIIRWLDFNDTWLAAEWGHPSDNLGGILAISDHLSQKQLADGQPAITMKAVLEAMVMAHEIQGCLALENSFNSVGLDHVVLVKVASTAVIAKLLNVSREQMLSAISHAWVDGQSLRTYRHAPNAGSRKSWAAGDATSRAVRLVDIAIRGEMGIPGALTAPQWGFYDVLFTKNNRDQSIKPVDKSHFSFQRTYGSYVMENVLFKISFPAEFHAQTACEAAMILYPNIKQRLDQIERVELTTHESAIRIISKEGPLTNAADRDHCLQYMTAVALLFGNLTADHYTDTFHNDHPEIDALRKKMIVIEDKQYSHDYHNPEKRSISNAIKIYFKDGSNTEKVEVEYPIGHRRRREEGIPLLKEKFKNNLNTCFSPEMTRKIYNLCNEPEQLEIMPVSHFMDLLVSL